MKTKVIVLLFIVLLTGSMVASAESGKEKVIVLIGTTTCVPTNLGEWKTLPSGNTKVRGFANLCYGTYPAAPSPFQLFILAGTMDCNLDKNMTGSCWGTLATPPGLPPDIPILEGVWQGKFNLASLLGTEGTLKLICHGQSVLVENLKVEGELIYDGTGAPAASILKVFNPEGW